MTSGAGDPFGERARAHLRAQLNVLGGAFTVESGSAALLQLAVDAFGGLPRHRLAPETRRFRARLVVTDHRSRWPRSEEPPPAVLSAGGGLLCATIDAGNFAIVDVATSSALVGVSPGMLRRPYHARYELVELALLTWRRARSRWCPCTGLASDAADAGCSSWVRADPARAR